ncbi:PREDICTED: blue copper protein [Nicotiana attenuata]|uniref:Phytocyanin domain-containing protein n=1 Tax=Nicotiana attenuata TaxID=49451 RepID=A0A1J6K8A0_NICAT|nr:PREDICTED: blue copper protein [Nicotiana attenuata]OIT26354.1 hypothetical protein A4A49_36291 [Nicotiana attenuata]
MEQSFNSKLQWFLLLIIFFISFSRSADAYKNYTVGDSLGWFDNLEKPTVNYGKWVAGKNFSLGDFLIFNTDNNHSVIQTYNFTTYTSCDYDNALNNDTIQWSSTDPSSTAVYPVSIAVPLLKVGTTYFFSGDYDGEQCENGQNFKINVTHGQGLPRSLRDPSDDDSEAPMSPISGDDESVPDTIVPASFDHPHEVSDDNPEPSNSVSLSIFSKFFGTKLNWIFVVVGLAFSIC